MGGGVGGLNLNICRDLPALLRQATLRGLNVNICRDGLALLTSHFAAEVGNYMPAQTSERVLTSALCSRAGRALLARTLPGTARARSGWIEGYPTR